MKVLTGFIEVIYDPIFNEQRWTQNCVEHRIELGLIYVQIEHRKGPALKVVTLERLDKKNFIFRTFEN